MLKQAAVCVGTLGLIWLGAVGGPVAHGDDSHPALTLHFDNPERFTDLRPANESRARFEGRMLEGFERIFSELADELPEGWMWQVTITDIDLAGDIRHDARVERFRTVTPSHPPRINLTHRLLDDQGEIIIDAEERLLDLSFMDRLPRATLRRRQALYYEYTMLTRWFEQTIRPHFEPGAEQ